MIYLLNDILNSGPFYHGTKASLKSGDLLKPGYSSNYGERKKANYFYLTATMDAAAWGAELAAGDGPGRIYLVEPKLQKIDRYLYSIINMDQR